MTFPATSSSSALSPSYPSLQHSAQSIAMTTPAAPSVRPIVFFDITVGSTSAGRIKIELFNDKVPKYVTVLEKLLHLSLSSLASFLAR